LEYRAEHVGSLLRPIELLAAREEYAKGLRTLESLTQLEDECILRALKLQSDLGLDVVSDGEYRRGGWSEAWTMSLEGLIAANLPQVAALPTAWQGGYLEQEEAPPAHTSETVPRRLVVQERVRQTKRLTGHESRFMAEQAVHSFKITMPGAMMFATSAYMPGVTDKVYASRRAMTQDLVQIMKREVEALISEGVDYIQLDSLRYVMPLADAELRSKMVATGQSPEDLLEETIDCDNACLEGIDRSAVTIGLHMCRGNNRSAWAASGPYDFVAEQTFRRLNVDRFLLEYDDERSGGFECLRFVPEDKTVVLGLVSTKHPELEDIDTLCRRIDEAARYHPLDKLAVSPQCGFASMAPGNLLSQDDQARKLELVVAVARRVWS
jgi:5-methyltetrahydropteroyltriglutamate--homocysteine methyltransferase